MIIQRFYFVSDEPFSATVFGHFYKLYIEIHNYLRIDLRDQQFPLSTPPQSATISLDDCDTALAINYGDQVGSYYCANSTSYQLEPR